VSLTIGNLTFDCEDPTRLAAFWAEALREKVDDGGNEFFVSIGRGRPEAGPNWFFIKVPEGKTAKNRLHLDLLADDRQAELARLVELGAKHVADKEEWGNSWSVMADVEGNEFCVADQEIENGAD